MPGGARRRDCWFAWFEVFHVAPPPHPLGGTFLHPASWYATKSGVRLRVRTVHTADLSKLQPILVDVFLGYFNTPV